MSYVLLVVKDERLAFLREVPGLAFTGVGNINVPFLLRKPGGPLHWSLIILADIIINLTLGSSHLYPYKKVILEL